VNRRDIESLFMQDAGTMDLDDATIKAMSIFILLWESDDLSTSTLEDYWFALSWDWDMNIWTDWDYGVGVLHLTLYQVDIEGKTLTQYPYNIF